MKQRGGIFAVAFRSADREIPADVSAPDEASGMCFHAEHQNERNIARTDLGVPRGSVESRRAGARHSQASTNAMTWQCAISS